MIKHPRSGVPVIILLKDGTVHTGHFLKNANYKITNINKWRIYGNKEKGMVIDDDQVADWLAPDCIAMNWLKLCNDEIAKALNHQLQQVK